jgi:hypothetical protein
MARPTLKVESSDAPIVPAPRGPMIDARTIATELFAGSVSEQWVRANVPNRVKLSHRTIRWYRVDVERWIAERRKAG